METNKQVCPCCGNHCPLDALQCGRGKRYVETGEIPEKGEHQKNGKRGHKHEHEHSWEELPQEEHLSRMLAKCGHILRHQAGGKVSQSRVLQMLERHEGSMTQKELGTFMDVQPGSLSELLGKMEQSQLIERSQNVQDKRNMDVTLTQTGKTQYEITKAAQVKAKNELFTCLTETEKVELEQILEKIIRNWKSTHHEEHHRHKHQ